MNPVIAKAPGFATQREIIYRTAGRAHGAINRVLSPGDVGELIKPFIFLDYFNATPNEGPAFGWHPHSGLATLTLLLTGSTTYADSTGKSGQLAAGSVEWMRSGSGVWHTGTLSGAERVSGFQLWVALPPQLEHAAPLSQYLSPDEVQRDGPVRVALGSYGKASSKIEAPSPINYLHVQLKAGERWRYQPPAGHDVAWVFVHQGRLHAAGEVVAAELAVFNESEAAIEFEAEGDTAFVLGSAVKHPHELVSGYYSVHTSDAALETGEAEIRRLGADLRARGVL
ncbi:MAG TPA: pirin family protein [Telluria sp.]|nr:pirin family protein [Telluria sp.]